MVRFALLLFLASACGQSLTPSFETVVWRSDAIVTFPNHGVGDLEQMGGNLISLTGEGAAITGTKIIAIDPDSGRTRWTDTILTDLVPAGDQSGHYAHFVRDRDDLIALVTDGTSHKGAVIRFSVATRRAIWKYAIDQTLAPESLSVHNSVTCFAGEDPLHQYEHSVTCLDLNGKRLWTRMLRHFGSAVSGAEIEIAASKLIVLEEVLGEPLLSLATVLDLQTGAPTTASLAISAGWWEYIAVRHLARWKEDKVVVFLTGGIAVVDLLSRPSQPQILIPVAAGQSPRAQEIAVGGSTAYVMYDLPAGDHPKADVVAAFDLESGKELWKRTDSTHDDFARMRPMRLQDSHLLYGDHDGGVWMLDASSGVVQRHVVPDQSPVGFLDETSPLMYRDFMIVSENFGPGPLDYRFAAIQ